MFLFGGIKVFVKLLTNSSIFLNIGFWERLKEILAEKNIPAIETVRKVSLEVIELWELPPIPKIFETFELLLVILSVVIFDEVPKDNISDMFKSFDEAIILKLQCLMDPMTANDLLCKLEMEDLIFCE